MQNNNHKIKIKLVLTFASCLELLLRSFLWFDSPLWLGVEVVNGKGDDVALCKGDEDERCLWSFLDLLASLRSSGPESRLLWFFSRLTLERSFGLSWFLLSFSFRVRLLCSCLFEWFCNNLVRNKWGWWSFFFLH